MRTLSDIWLLALYLLHLTESLPDGFTDSLSGKGKEELHRVQRLATQPRYGGCWSRALEDLDTHCRELTADTQSRIALRFTHCHLERSGRAFPSCPEGSEVSQCTTNMDAVAFNAYTEFFTHTQSICHYLQSEAWQHRAENTIHRLTDSSAAVAEQLESTRQLAEDLVEAQSAALLVQEEILRSGEQLQHTLHHSTQGLREIFSEMRVSSREQQVSLSEMFNRVAFLQSFILSEAHTLGCVLYNALALCAAFLLTATQRTAKARLILFGLVFMNVYLERMIYRAALDSDSPAYLQMELVTHYVSVLRRVMMVVGVVVLVCVALRYRDVTKESLEILTQLKETQNHLQRALEQTESLSSSGDKRRSLGRSRSRDHQRRREERGGETWRREERGGETWRREERGGETWQRMEEERGAVEQQRRKERGGEDRMSPELSEKITISQHAHSGWNDDSVLSSTVISSTEEDHSTLLCPHTHHTMTPRSQNAAVPSPSTQHASVSPGRRLRPSSSSPLVHNIPVEDRQTPRSQNAAVPSPSTQHASVSPGRRLRPSSSSPLVHNIPVEDRQRGVRLQTRYSLRSRSLLLPETHRGTH